MDVGKGGRADMGMPEVRERRSLITDYICLFEILPLVHILALFPVIVTHRGLRIAGIISFNYTAPL